MAPYSGNIYEIIPYIVFALFMFLSRAHEAQSSALVSLGRCLFSGSSALDHRRSPLPTRVGAAVGAMLAVACHLLVYLTQFFIFPVRFFCNGVDINDTMLYMLYIFIISGKCAVQRAVSSAKRPAAPSANRVRGDVAWREGRPGSRGGVREAPRV